jgi:hypothetical protein
MTPLGLSKRFNRKVHYIRLDRLARLFDNALWLYLGGVAASSSRAGRASAAGLGLTGAVMVPYSWAGVSRSRHRPSGAIP